MESFYLRDCRSVGFSAVSSVGNISGIPFLLYDDHAFYKVKFVCSWQRFFTCISGRRKGESDKGELGRWINKDNETLFDLIFGCIVYSIVFEVIGLLVVENKGSYSMGLCLEQL